MSLNTKRVCGERVFAVAAIAVLAFAFLVAVAAPGVGAASDTRVAAVKTVTVTQAAVAPSSASSASSAIAANPVSPIVNSVVSVSRVNAVKTGVVQAPISAYKRVDAVKVGSAPQNQAQARNQQKPVTPNCNQLEGPVSEELSCTDVTIIGDVRIYGPNGHLTVTGPTLKFDGSFKLEVYGDGKLTIRSNTEVSLNQRSDYGYTISTQGESVVNIEGESGNPVTMTDAEDVYFEGPTRINYLEYHDNANGLTVQSGAVIENSKFYDNGGDDGSGYGLKVNGNRVNVSGSEFYGQKIGVLLDYAQAADIQDNDFHDNTVAGIKSVMPVPEQEREQKLGFHGGGAVPNVLRGNTITGNRDGVVEYSLGLDIDETQAGLIRDNALYGLVSIDSDANAGIEASIGTNGAGKAANLRSMRVGGKINTGEMPTNLVYVDYCEENIDDCANYDGNVNYAFNYNDYSQAYTRTPTGNHGYFTSNLIASEDGTYNGNHGMWTPRFLVYVYRLADSTRNYACDENVNGFDCVARIVTTFENVDFGGNFFQIQPGPQYGHVFKLMSGGGLLNANKKQAPKTTPTIQTPNTSIRRAAVKVSSVSVSVLNAVKTTPDSVSRITARKV